MQIVEQFESGPLPFGSGAFLQLALLTLFLLLAVVDSITKFGEDEE